MDEARSSQIMSNNADITVIMEHVLKGAVNSERVYGKPKIPLSYNEPMNPVSAVYNVVTKK